MLSPATGSKQMFDVLGNAEKDNYFKELTYNMDIIDIIFNDVDAYAREDKVIARVPKSTDNSRPASPEKPTTELQQIAHLLEKVHGKICTLCCPTA